LRIAQDLCTCYPKSTRFGLSFPSTSGKKCEATKNQLYVFLIPAIIAWSGFNTARNKSGKMSKQALSAGRSRPELNVRFRTEIR
jgi:hypothetical protein